MSILAVLFHHEGRINRFDFWIKGVLAWFGLGFCALGLAIFIYAATSNFIEIMAIILIVTLTHMWCAIMVKRCHDLGHPGSLIFMVLIPILGYIFLLWCGFAKGQPYDNNYGPIPRATASTTSTTNQPTQTPINQPPNPPHTWHSPQKIANWTLNLLAIHILIVIASIVSTWLDINLIQSIEDGKPIPESVFNSNETRQTIVILYRVSHVTVVISFLMWIARASKNLSALGTSNQKCSPIWAVGWWFIPIASLWQPYKVTAEIWVESHPGRLRPPAWFAVWWAAWIVAHMLRYSSFNASASNPNGTILEDSLAIASDPLQITAALYLIILVRRITTNQIQKHQTSADQDTQ